MNAYPLLRNVLFKFDPERIHCLTLATLNTLYRLKLLHTKKLIAPVKTMGISFPNPVGLAAGFDRNCEFMEALEALGFGFIEAGTITPLPQTGHPKPRLYRLPNACALINRIGFANEGVNYAFNRVKQTNYKGILGINIGKNSNTPLEHSSSDYVNTLRKLYPYAHYFAVNISSPNTPDLRRLQFGEYLNKLLKILKAEQSSLAEEHNKYVPLVLKIAPDLSVEELKQIVDSLLTNQIDGVIATNSTTSRQGIEGMTHAGQAGGLSGRPLFAKSLEIVTRTHEFTNGELPIIACGGIMSADDAKQMINAGASLVQIYTGFVYEGPKLIKEIVTALK